MPHGIFRRHDRVDVAAEHFSGAIAEQMLAGLVEHEHTCLFVDQDDPVDGSVEHAQQPGFGNRGQYWSRIDDLAPCLGYKLLPELEPDDSLASHRRPARSACRSWLWPSCRDYGGRGRHNRPPDESRNEPILCCRPRLVLTGALKDFSRRDP